MLILYTTSLEQASTLHYLVPQPGRLFQQHYIASIGVTPRASEASYELDERGELDEIVKHQGHI